MNRSDSKDNISLIGMSACGKSTIGVLLAKVLNMMFLDTDLIMQQKYGKFLYQILESDGIYEFVRKESETVLSLKCTKTCIATGGSVVYSEKAMEHLKNISTLVFIDLSYPSIENRITDIKNRGIVIEKGKTLFEVYRERRQLYQKYADITVNADGKSVEELIEKIKNQTDRAL